MDHRLKILITLVTAGVVAASAGARDPSVRATASSGAPAASPWAPPSPTPSPIPNSTRTSPDHSPAPSPTPVRFTPGDWRADGVTVPCVSRPWQCDWERLEDVTFKDGSRRRVSVPIPCVDGTVTLSHGQWSTACHSQRTSDWTSGTDSIFRLWIDGKASSGTVWVHESAPGRP